MIIFHFKDEVISMDVDIVKSYGIHVIIGVIFGAIFAVSLDTKSLILFFTTFVITFFIEKESILAFFLRKLLSPGFMPNPKSIKCIAPVQLEVGIAYLHLKYFLKLFVIFRI